MYQYRDNNTLTHPTPCWKGERVKGEAEIIVAKQRNGPIGDIKLLWQHDYTRFVNLEHRPYDEFEQFSDF